MEIKIVYRLVILLTGFQIELDWIRTTSDTKLLHVKHNFVSGLEDEAVLQCPYISTCAYNLSVELTGSGNPLTDGCCLPCGSDINRQKMKCCDSIMPCVNPVINDANQQLACIPTNLMKSLTKDNGILAVVTCSDGSDDNIMAQCLQDYQSDSVDVYDIIPVSDVNTHAVYRNTHCAFCNGVKVDYVKHWLVNVVCVDTSNIDVRSDVDILAVVRSHAIDRCDLKFINPEPDGTARQCNQVIDKCNVTGLWLKYQRGIERDCINSKPEQYTLYKHMFFKSEHCAFCNGMRSGPTIIINEIPSFSLLLPFKTKSGVDDQSASVCSPGNIFLKTEGRCVEARCSLLRRLHNNLCERTIHTFEALSYRIGLRLTTDVVINIQTALNIAHVLQEPINYLLHSVFGSLESIVFNIFLVADLDYNQVIDVTAISQANLLWYDIRLKLKNVESQDPEEKLEMLLRLSKNVDINLNITDGLVINVKVKPMDDFIYLPYERYVFYPCTYDFIDFDLCSDINSSRDTGLASRYGHYTAVRYVGHYDIRLSKRFYGYPITSERNILEFRSCPFIEVKMNNVSEWKETSSGLQYLPTRFDLSLSDFFYGENGDGLWVCANIYNALFNSGNMYNLRATCAANTFMVVIVLGCHSLS